jgi:hypothetical protein
LLEGSDLVLLANLELALEGMMVGWRTSDDFVHQQ